MKNYKKIKKENLSDVISLTSMQEGMLFHYLKNRTGSQYVAQLTLELRGEIDTGAFQRAWQWVTDVNPMLRTVFRWKKMNKPVQMVLKSHTVQTGIYDYSGRERDDAQHLGSELAAADRKQFFDLTQVPFRITLCLLPQNRSTMIISNHHILYDGWSTGIILKEFFSAYNDFSGDVEPAKPVKSKFKNYVKMLSDKARNNRQKEKTFWETYLEGYNNPGEFLSWNTKAPKESPEEPGHPAHTADFKIGKSLWRQIEEVARQYRVTAATILYGAWGILMQNYHQSNDVVFGAPIAGRGYSKDIKGIEDIVGLFINTLPLRIHTGPGENASELLLRIHQSLSAQREYETSALVDIHTYCGLDQGSQLFDSLVLIENYPLDRQMSGSSGALSVENYTITEASNYNVTLTVYLLEEPKVQLNIKPGLWDPSYIQQVGTHFMRILEQIVGAPEAEISRIDLLSPGEKEHQLAELNNTRRDFPADTSIYHMFEDQAEAIPHHIALTGITHPTEDSRPANPRDAVQLSYRYLNESADNLAGLLVREGTTSETIIGVMMERSVQMIISLLAIWKAGGAYLPIDPEYPAQRIQYMLEDSRAPLLITSRYLTGGGKPADSWSGKTILIEEAMGQRHPAPSGLKPPAGSDSRLAYTIYTSGSTGKPKGVLVTHRNVARLVKGSNYIRFQRNQSMLLTSALQFDVSTFEIWGALANGMTLALPTRDEVLQPRSLKKILRIYDIHSMWLTTSLFNQLCQLDAGLFASLTTLMVGGDALSPVHINKVREACPGLVVINGYGPSENTSFSTTHHVQSSHKKNVPIGRPIANSTAYIMDTRHRLLPPGVPGELVVGGYGVARGYLNNPQLTSERFISAFDCPDLSLHEHSARETLLYKTGDLARWLPGDIIQFLGRIDYQVKIRGFRIELGEIETIITAYDDIDEAIVVCGTQDDGERYLCAYVTGNGNLDISRLREYLGARLPDHMIPAYFALLDAMPITPNGKIDRKALPHPQLGVIDDYTPPRTQKEKQLVLIWAGILALEPGQISADQSFFRLGGNSLNIIALTTRIHKEFNLELSLNEVLEHLTIQSLASYIQQKEPVAGDAVKPVEKADFYTASSAQKRIYIIQQKDPRSTAYHVTGAFRLQGEFEMEKIEQVFRKLIDRHESLRTSFREVSGQPVQIVNPDAPFQVALLPGIEDPGEVRKAVDQLVEPFNLAKAPLFRVGSLPFNPDGPGRLLIVDMHHIISDGISISILIREFIELYAGGDPGAPHLQYKDYSHWQTLQVQGKQRRLVENYWLELFPRGAEIPLLHLPIDDPRPPVKSYEGHTLHFSIDTALSGTLRQLASIHGATMFMVLLAAFNLFLSRISGEEDIVVGTPVSGRRRHELDDIVGMFVNTLPIRNFPRGELSFNDFLSRVKENMFAALENQDYPLEELVEKAGVPSDPSRNALFDVLFALDAADLDALHIPGLDIAPVPYDSPVSKFDMTFTAKQKADTLDFSVAYDAALFREQTMQRLIQCFKEVLADAAANPETRLKDVRLLPGEQEKQLLYEFNNTAATYPEGETLHGLFFRQARRTPDAIALKGATPNPVQISYRQLMETSLRIASLLRQKGIGDDAIVPVMTQRSVAMISSLIGVLAAGAGYLPLLPDYPVERIKYMLDDSGASLLISNSPRQAQGLESLCPGLEVIDPDGVIHSNEPVEETGLSGSPGHLAYVLYTSGTTGKPKGVMVEHGNAVNVVWWFGKTFSLGPRDNVLQMSDYIFDPSVNQIFGTLPRGATLCLVSRDTLLNIQELARFIDRFTINLIYSVPFILNPLLASRPRLKSLHTVLSAGDRLDNSLKNAIVEKGYQLYNLYGPTETAIDALFEKCGGGGVTLGKPVANMSCVVMDKHGNPVPVGVGGELYVAGTGVARGYLNAPLLTHEKYLPSTISRHLRNDKNQRMYRTGDRVRTTPDGRFEFLGRLDHQVKVNGYRVELQEIENLVLRDEAVKECVVQVIKSEVNEYLCAYYVASSPLSLAPLKERLGRALPKQMIPAVFMELESLPLTAAGKVDRKSLPQPEETGKTGKTGTQRQSDRIEETLIGIWSEVLEVEAENIKTDSNFFQLGGHSLKMTVVGSRIHEQLGVEVPVGELFKHITPGELSAYLRDILDPDPDASLHGTLTEIWSQVLEIEAENIKPDSNFFQLGGHSLKMTVVGSRIHEQLGVEVPVGELFKHLTIGELAAYLKGILTPDPNASLRRTLTEIWSQVLEIEAENIKPDSNFFQLGGHSLKMTVVGSRIHEQLGVEVPVGELFKHLTIGELAVYMSGILTPDPGASLRRTLTEIWSGVLEIEAEKIEPDSNFFQLGGHSLHMNAISSKIHEQLGVKVAIAELFNLLTIDELATHLEGILNPAPGASLRLTLTEIWSQVLEVEAENIKPDSNFFQLGGHSLKMTAVGSRIHEELGVEVPVGELFKHLTIDELAAYMETEEAMANAVKTPEPSAKDRAKLDFVPIRPVEEREYYALSSAQKRLYILYQMEPHSTTYNMPVVLELEGSADIGRMEKAFKELVKRHDSFRTSFHLMGDEPVQRIHRDVEFEIQHRGSDETVVRDFVQPFDLSRPPLLRVLSSQTGENRCLLLIDIHHIIADGSSMSILADDFFALYNGTQLPGLGIQYKDFSEWRNSEEQFNRVKRQREFWINRFSDEIPVLNLPLDFPRPAVQSFEGDTEVFELGVEQTRGIYRLAREQGATLFMVLLGIINVLLYKLSGQQDIVTGAPVAGRGQSGLESLIGMFVNTLALRNRLSPQSGFNGFLEDLRAETLQAFDNQDYPFEELVEALDVRRDAGRNPLFDVLFVLQNVEESSINQTEGLTLTQRPYVLDTSKFDLQFSIFEMDEILTVSMEYCTRLFQKSTILRMADYFKQVTDAIIENPGIALEDIQIIGEKEKEEILRMSTGEVLDLEEDTIHRLFQQKAAGLKNETALVFQGQTLSYGQLNKKSNQLARRLRKMGVTPDTIVGLMVERSFEMVIGILAILKAGGAYMPIDAEYPDSRKTYMLEDSEVSLLLTNFDDSHLTGFVPEHIEILSLENDALYKEDSRNLRQTAKGSSLVYLIYTSGSTGEPKGIMMEHRCMANLMNFQFNHTNIEFSRVLQFTTISFDVSFQDIFSPLLHGGKLYLVDKDTRAGIPDLFEYIRQNEIETLFLPASFLKFVMNEDEYVRLMPACVRHIVTAGEQLIVSNRFRSYLKKNQVWLHNHYGPAETHVVTTFTMDPSEEIPELPSIGKPVINNAIYILDHKQRYQPIGVPGELFIGGNQVGRGYYNRDQLTAERYLDSPFATGPRLYRTGDLGRWMADGNIEFLGRKDFQVKIRGFRVELGEIESQLLAHDEISEAAVVLKKENRGDQRYLCAYFVCDGELSTSALRMYLSGQLPEYMIPAYFFQLEKIPVTPNGKVDTRALPEPEMEAGEDFTAPRNRLETKLAEIWAGVLALEKEKISKISIDDDFFQVGGHSLKATLLASRIHKALNVNVPVTRIFQSPTIRGLAEFIKDAEEYRFVSLEQAEKQEHYPLSSAQMRIYLLQQMTPEATGYNMPTFMTMTGTPDRNKFEGAFRQLVNRHESLRTTFDTENFEPVQRVHDDVEFNIQYFEVPENAVSRTIDAFIRPFDLSQCPLLRIGLLKTDDGQQFLMVDMHHIISDGISCDILIKDFMALYADKSLPELRIQYKDYSQWLDGPERKESVKLQQEYWLQQFEGELPLLNLPLDYPRPAVQGFEGAVLNFELDEQNTGALKSMAYEDGGTLYITLLAIYKIFLAKLTNQEDIVVGSPVAGRRHADLENIIGIFINTLALRGYPAADKSSGQFLEEVKELALAGFTHQDYPYEDLVETVGVQRDTSRNPLFDTLFALQNIGIADLEIPGVTLKSYAHKSRIAKFDLSLYAMEADEKLSFVMEYNTNLFKRKTIERFAAYFKAAITGVLGRKQATIAEIEILPGHEKRQLLYDFNDTAVDYPGEKTLHRLFEEQARRTPNRVALSGSSLPGPEETPLQLTYRELNEKSNRLARVLQHRGVKPGSLTALISGRFVDMITAIWGILKAGAAYIPLDPTYPSERIKYILKDSSANIIVTTEKMEDFANEGYEMVELDDGNLYNRLDKDAIRDLETPMNSSHLAYAIYTSGSTGKPKGVMIPHRQVNNFIKGIIDIIDFTPVDTILSLTTISFDIFGLETILPLTRGSRVIIGNMAQQMDAAETARTIVREGVSILQVTPSRLLMLTSNQEASSSLKELTSLLVGGEAFPLQLLNKTRELGVDNIFNMYGPTETTIWSAVKDLSAGKDLNIGKPIANTGIYILGKGNSIQPIGVAGELCISGDGLARGYVNRPQLTAEKFVHVTLDSQPLTLYRTGDLACWLPDGNIQFMGRLDFQVKIRGFRIELGEIENRLLRHDKIEEAVVLAKQADSSEYHLAAYFVCAPTLATDDIREYLAAELPDYMIPSYYTRLDEMPLTPNGKVDRKKLPEPQLTLNAGEIALPEDDLEKKLALIWKEVLFGKDADNSETVIGIDQNFFLLGGHSLKATFVMSRIHKEFGVKLPFLSFFSHQTIRQLAKCIRETGESTYTYTVISPVEEREYYPLSSAQKRLYILQQINPDTTGYNIPVILNLKGEPDKNKFQETFLQVIKRHDSLRTSFEMIDNEPVQRIHDTVDFSLDTPETIKDFIRPFDLSQAPLLRAGLITRGPGQYILISDMHHIISDGVSGNLMVKDFAALYKGMVPAEPRIQYKDFSLWENGNKQSEIIKQHEKYWLNRFSGELPVLNLPTDHARPAVHNYEGAAVRFDLNADVTRKLKTLFRDREATLFMGLLSLFTILLSRLGNQEDISVGTPIAGRRHTDLEQVIGMFVNTLAIRNYPSGEKTYGEFLNQVKASSLEAFENQDYQYENLVEALNITRILNRNPLFDTMFVLQNMDAEEIELPGLNMSPYEYDGETSKFDLVLTALEGEENLFFKLGYNSELFKPETIENFIKYFEKIISSVIDNREKRLSEIEIISDLEKRRLLHRFNDTWVDYPRDKTVHRLFEDQAEHSPDLIAVNGRWSSEDVDVQITYDELNQKANQLAATLRTEGVEPDTIVGIAIERSLEMIIGLLGILKAGGAYMPVSPAYPAERIRYMLADSNAKILLTSKQMAQQLETGMDAALLDINQCAMERLPRSNLKPANPDSGARSSDLAYVLYTSGSTGKPKGVLVAHYNVANVVLWFGNRYDIGPGTQVLQMSDYTFDPSVNQIFGTLLKSGSIVLIQPETLIDTDLIRQFIQRHRINIINFVPSVLHGILSSGPILKSIKYVLTGGERLDESWKEDIIGRGYQMHNQYGLTETTIDALAGNCQYGKVTLGSPISNTTCHILDKYGNQTPIGIPGELYVAGDGVARGYLNKPELTEEKFVSLTINGRQVTLYRTGDLVRWLPDGNIEFFGRIDHQVKIRGFRVELGEIENRLLQHDEIKEAVVLAKQGNSGESQLHAYIVTGSELTIQETREFLSGELPDYMIPAYFARLDKIPLTASGKVDLKALETNVSRLDSGVEYAAPRNNFETQISEIWKEELDVDKIGIYDNFFDLGGNSLNIVKMSNRLKELSGKTVSVMTMFRYPSIHLLSQYVSEEEMKISFSEDRINESVEMMEDSILMFIGENDE